MKKNLKFSILTALCLSFFLNFKAEAVVSQAMMSSVSGYLSFESCNDYLNHNGRLVPCLFFLALSASIVLPRKVEMVKPLALTVALGEESIELDSLDPRLRSVIEEINDEIENQGFEPLKVKDAVALITAF